MSSHGDKITADLVLGVNVLLGGVLLGTCVIVICLADRDGNVLCLLECKDEDDEENGEADGQGVVRPAPALVGSLCTSGHGGEKRTDHDGGEVDSISRSTMMNKEEVRDLQLSANGLNI